MAKPKSATGPSPGELRLRGELDRLRRELSTLRRKSKYDPSAGVSVAETGGGSRSRAAATEPPAPPVEPSVPKLAEVLNANGVRQFRQIAAWGPGEIEWIEANSGFSGRVVRDDWIGQAKILAAGGETEHSQRVDRGEST